MKKRPKSLPAIHSAQLVDRKLACGLLVAALIGGTAATSYAADNSRGGYSPAPQAVDAKHTVSGTVIDENGDPMIGVSVMQEGTNNGVATDFDGNFTLSVPAGASLHFSYIGYKPQTIRIDNQRTLEITMQPDDNVLDEVVAIGYGTVKKRDLTGAVASVKNEDITLSPTANAMDALQGKIAGLDITRASGQAGATPTVQLRGNRSFTASGTPTYGETFKLACNQYLCDV